MKRILSLLAAASLTTAAIAQTAPAAGHVQYEATQKVDLSQVRIVINGQQVKPGSPDFPTDIPDTRSFGLTVAFSGTHAKEERENAATRIVMEGGPGGSGGVPQTTKVAAPFKEETYVGAADRAFTTILSLTDQQPPVPFRADQPFEKPASWQEASGTKKIAGYSCRKATATLKGAAYTIWYTPDLPFTYSPVKELVPDKGVALLIESEQEQYRATKVDTKAVALAEVQPPTTPQHITPAEMKDMREKARANFRQKMMENMQEREGGRGRE